MSANEESPDEISKLLEAYENDKKRSINEDDFSCPKSKENQDNLLVDKLKRERIQAKWTIRIKAIKLLKDKEKAKNEAAALKLIPFDPARLLLLPIPFKESFLLLIIQIISFHLLNTITFKASFKCRQETTKWLLHFLNHIKSIFNIEESPAICQIKTAIKNFGSSETTTEFDDASNLCNQTDEGPYEKQITLKSFEDFCKSGLSSKKKPSLHSLTNPQPAKCNFLMQTEKFLKKDIDTFFHESVEGSKKSHLQMNFDEEMRSEPNNLNDELKTSSSNDLGQFDGQTNAQNETNDMMMGQNNPTVFSTVNARRRSEVSITEKIPQIHILKEPEGCLQWDTAGKSFQKIVQSEQVLHPKDQNEKFIQLKPPFAYSVVLRDFLLVSILSGYYDARIYEILKELAECLDLQFLTLLICAQDYLVHDLVGSMQADNKESTKTKTIRRLKVAGVAVGIGALTALTAGLAAPAIAAGFGALGIAGTSGATAFLATLGGSATVASVFGAGTAGLTGWKYSKRIGKLKVFQFDRLMPTENCHSREFGGLQSEDSDSEDFGNLSDTEIELARITTSDCDNLWAIDEVKGMRLGAISDHVERELDNVSTKPTNQSKKTNSGDSKSMTADTQLQPIVIKSHKCFIDKDIINDDSHNLQRTCKMLEKEINSPSLTITICLSGWLRSMDDIWQPWKDLCSNCTDVYALRWDPEILLELGDFLILILGQKFAVTAAQLWLQYTIAGALSAALMWPVALIQYAATLDNTWMACKERSQQAGRMLADALCDSRSIGTRPVNLIGFSVGARVVHVCLQELHRRNAFNRVHNAILLGVPTSCDKSQWQRSREVVSGRLVNAYSRSDWLLGFLFRYMEWGVTVAGVAPVKVDGVENIDVTGLVKFGQYADKVQDILTFIGYHAVPGQQTLNINTRFRRHRDRSP